MFDVQSVGVKLCLEVQLFKAQRPWSRSPAQASPPQGSGRARIDRSESGRWRRARRRPRRAAAARLPPRGVYATVVTDITLSVNAQAAGARLNGRAINTPLWPSPTTLRTLFIFTCVAAARISSALRPLLARGSASLFRSLKSSTYSPTASFSIIFWIDFLKFHYVTN